MQASPARVLALAGRQARGKADKSAPGAIERTGADCLRGPFIGTGGGSRWGQKDKGKGNEPGKAKAKLKRKHG